MAALRAEREVLAQPAPSGASAGEGLALFSYPLLVDEGRLSEGADALKASLEEPAFVQLSDADAASLGIADGATVTVRTASGLADLPARVGGVAEGAVFVPFNQASLDANRLLAGTFTTPVTVEGGGA